MSRDSKKKDLDTQFFLLIRIAHLYILSKNERNLVKGIFGTKLIRFQNPAKSLSNFMQKMKISLEPFLRKTINQSIITRTIREDLFP